MSETIKVEIVVREDDGRTVIKTLEGEDALRWSKMVASVCELADMRGANPDWRSLNWQKRDLTTQQN